MPRCPPAPPLSSSLYFTAVHCFVKKKKSFPQDLRDLQTLDSFKRRLTTVLTVYTVLSVRSTYRNFRPTRRYFFLKIWPVRLIIVCVFCMTESTGPVYSWQHGSSRRHKAPEESHSTCALPPELLAIFHKWRELFLGVFGVGFGLNKLLGQFVFQTT